MVKANIDQEVILIRGIGQKDETAFIEIYQIYHRQIYNYLVRTLNDPIAADDVLQEVFLAIWQGAAGFRHKSTPKTWIYRIAHKRAISWLRKHKRVSESVELHDQIRDNTSPEEIALVNLENHQLGNALMILPLKHRSVLELAFGQDMSYSEVAEVLNIPVGTVKSRMSHALDVLNKALTSEAQGDHKAGR
jgi:RNA polymerase sigma-70 factor (ECF subfamily)